MVMQHNTTQLLALIGEKSMLQSKFLSESLQDITAEEASSLESLVEFYKTQDNSLEQIADKYLNLVNSLFEEQKYFFEYEKYRHSTYNEAKHIYENPQHMDSYAIGLGLSVFLWQVHRDIMRFFKKYLKLCVGGRYFEIGPGHGENFVSAMKAASFDNFTAIDISRTCIEQTLSYIKYSFGAERNDYKIICGNFFDYPEIDKFDSIVMGEVLEHVENPIDFLKKIRAISNKNSLIYISTAINAPQLDHIYHFHNLQEVYNMLEQAGFKICDYVATTHKNIPLDKAEKKKTPIVCAFILSPNKEAQNA